MRRLFNIAVAISLLLCGCFGVSWAQMLWADWELHKTMSAYAGSGGFIIVHESNRPGPYTLPLLILAAACLPIAWLIHWRFWKRPSDRRLRGQCLKCGYDLRASKERCPECGTAIAAS